MQSACVVIQPMMQDKLREISQLTGFNQPVQYSHTGRKQLFIMGKQPFSTKTRALCRYLLAQLSSYTEIFIEKWHNTPDFLSGPFRKY